MSFDFNLPSATPIPSTFPSIDSFRGRLILIEVTGYEVKIPVQGQDGKFKDRVTAKVTTVDGRGQVQLFDRQVPTGQYVEGPEHVGIWFDHQRTLPVLAPEGERSIGRLTLAIPETYKPGKVAGKGNAWGLLDPTPEQVQAAREFLANMTVDKATASAPDPSDPFAV